jgi:hypothetical protein
MRIKRYFKYEELAIERDEYYTLMGLKTDVKGIRNIWITTWSEKL